MLFSGGGPSNKPKKEEKREKKSDRDDKYEVQEAVFTRWANSLFDDPITEIKDIVELSFLQAFTKLITGKTVSISGNRYDDIDVIIHILASDDDDKILALSVPDLCEGNVKQLLILCNSFINMYWRRFAPQEMGDRKISEAIRDWCLEATAGYDDVCVNDFTSSWRDGMALNILLHSYDSNIVDMNAVRDMRGDERLENALSIAKRYFKVPKLILSKEFHSEHLDSKSVLCYLMMLYIAMACYSNSQSSSSKKSSRSSDITRWEERPPETLQPPKESTILELSPTPSSSTNVTVIHKTDPMQQSTETISDVNIIDAETRSRHSSVSSSHKSSRKSSRSKKNENVLKEYERCLEKVLAWLLEADEELNSMEPVNESDVDTVKNQFRDHEQFMLSLTESKDKVGRVLHEGQKLVDELPEEEAKSVNDQLLLVNQRWEDVRCQAMLRQQALQVQLNKLQKEQLQQICGWLSGVEGLIEDRKTLPSDIEQCRQQITEHTVFEEQIEKQQQAIKKLASYMAVVSDESVDDDDYVKIESLLKEVGERWDRICSWTEKRAQNLDGICDLLKEYDKKFTHLSAWLTARQEELVRLRSAHHLTTTEEVEEQKKLIKEMDEALQKEHPSFVELSRLSTELRNRYKLENQEFTEKIIKDFDSVTQRWENIVSRLEEHSQMLNRVKLNPRTVSSQSDSSAQGESSREEGEARLSTEESDEIPRQPAAHSEETINIVELFIEKTKQFEASLKPLAERLKQLKNPTKQQFTVIADEFKTQLAQVEELDALAEKVHQSSMNQAELHAVNENHERAMMFYGKLVNEFTERIKYMQNPNASKDDTAKVELHLTEWIDMAKALWKDITNTPKEARGHRIDAFLIELLELQKKFSDFKAANQNTERFRPLENQLIELQQKARREKEKEKEEREKEQEEQQKEEQDPKKALEWIRNVIVELNRFNLNSGDLKHLKDLEQTLRITSEQLKGKLDVITDEDFVAETEKVVNILKKTTDELNVKINTIENIIHKAVTTEQLADKFERRLADLKRGQFELGVTESESRKLRDELFQHNGQKTKAIKQMDEMLQICQSSNEIEAANGWKTRINKLERQWKTLEKDVEEYISVVAKNYRKHFQDIVAEQEQLSNQLREAMIASGEATDAEELSEHVDNMEYLLEKLTKTGTEEVDPFQQYNLTNDTYVQREIERVNVQRKHIIDLAKERCARLQEAISKCEMFEKDLCNFQSWCQHMNHILNTRLSQDINALDVPHEYKKASAEGTLLSQMNTEFSEYDVLLRSLGEFIEESKSHWSSSDRLKLQKNHASAQLEELKGRFNLFKKPVQFEKSLESIEKMLQNVEESLDDLAGVKAENCEYCQIHISQTMKQVASCQETLIDLENKKDALVQEGIFDEEQAIIADQRLETALRKTQALDARAVNDMERLQQSAQLVKKYEAEKSNISKNIREIEDKAVKAPDDIRKSLEDAVAGIKKALELKAVLHQNAVRLSDSELDEYDRKVQILRNKYGSLLTSDSECADHLKTVVISLERSVNMLERSGDKKQMQQVREKLVNINRQLLNSGDEIRKELGPKVAEINSRISELERESRSISRTAKSLKETSSELHEPVLPPTTDLNSDNFEECVFEFLRSSKSLSSYLNFKTFPVEDTAKWVQRVKVASQVSASNEEYRERLVKFGREWAEKGRMELSDQQILDYLDESDALTTKNSEQIQSENELLNAFETLEEMTNNCLTSIKQNIEEIHKLDLTDQLNVLKAQDELEAVNERITESLIAIDKFSQNAPGREKIFQILYDKISELQVEVEYANARVRQALTDLLTTTEQVSDKEQDFKKKPVHPDGVSMSSGAGLSLAMDVQETEGEEYFSDAARNQNKIGDVFNDLDTFEDFFDRDESLPFEGIDEKDQYLNTIEQRLAEDKKVIKQMQMNMDVNEYEHTMGRFKALSQNLLTRRDNMRNNRSTIDNLFSFFSQAEEDVFKLDNIIRKADKNKSKDHSVDMEDWEAGQLETENLIPSLAVHIQQCENRYHNLKDKLSASLQNEFGTRLANLNDDFNLLRHAVEKNRMILEDKLADERYLLKNMNKFSNWCDEIEKFLNKQESFLDPLGLDASYELMKHRQTEVDEKILAFRSIEMLKDRFVALGDVDTEVKHRIRREITQLAKRISDLQLAMTKQTKELADLKEISDEFWTEVSKINNWVQDADVQVSNVEKAHLYKPMLFNLKKMIAESSDLKLQTQLMQRQVAEELLELKAPNEIHHQSGKTVDTVAKNFNNVIERARELLEGTLKEEQVEKLEFAPELELEQLESPPRNYNGRDDSTVEYGTLTNRDDSLPPASMKDSGSKSRAETEEFHDALDRPLAEAFDHLNNSTILDAKFNPEEKQRQEKCIQINGRLQEIERSISTTVNITDQSQIRQLISDNQNFLNEIGIHKVELQRILNQTEEQLISSRAIQCLYDLEKILESCKKRKLELTEMLHQTRLWEQLRSELELWLTEGNEKLMATERVNEMDEVTLEAELKSVNDITGTIDNMKAQMEQLNLRSNEMIDKFIYDDNHTLSQLTSKLNTQWTKFNESLCIRRAVLEASLRSRNDIHTTLTQLDGWLNKQLGILKQLDADTENKQRLKDTSKRRDWMGQERESNAEIEAHRQVITSVRDMCKNLLNVLEADNERQTLQNKLEAVEAKWVQINELDSIVRERIQNAQDECEKLTKDLSELLHWTDMQISTILHDQPVGGDLTTVQQQSDTIRKIERQFDSKNREVSDCIQLSHSYLMQHDLRPMIHRGSAFDSSKEMEKSDAQLEERRIGVQILADSEKLKSSYDALKQHLSAWQRVVSTAHRELQELDTAIAESLLAIGTIENEMDGMKLVEDLRLEELKEAKIEHAILKKRVQDTAVKVDDVNDCTGQIAAQNIVLSPHMEMQIQTVNARYEKLSKEVGIRGAALERAFTDFGPSSEHFLSESVQPPWQRSISALNQMPYYVDHVTENTQWDHPSMVDIFEKLCTFNQVKFSAYRTAMKLRALQKHMCLDLIDLPSLDQALHKYRNAPLDEKISIEDVVMTLVPLFESAHQKYPQLLRNVPLAVDLALNLLLNIYDPCRDGKLRTVSFAIAMVVLCNATLESKYKFLFSLITRDEGVDHKQLGLLFYDLIHITKLLGEAAVFGGSNIEPSVRSCFEYSKYPAKLSVDQYLSWLKKEPQSIVWLPVMHRLASSEFAKHQAKCNACKMFPIVGMRYRCLRCFNYDICQNCFFSQRTSKSHKLTHPMQEYCTPTKSKDDVRDFTLMVKNKMRRSRSKRGYLPVDTVDEGLPLENNQNVPQNPATETIHQRVQVFSQRLLKRQQESISAVNVQKALQIKEEAKVEIKSTSKQPLQSKLHKSATDGPGMRRDVNEIKSPSQLIKQVEQMHKEEMDQLLQKLQYENSELRQAVERKRHLGSTPNLEGMRQSGPQSGYPLSARHTAQPGIYASTQTMPHGTSIGISQPHPFAPHRIVSQPTLFSEDNRRHYGRSASSLPRGYSEIENFTTDQRRLLDAKSIRIHEHQLEERSRALEEQNKQLQIQLDRLQRVVDKQTPSEFPRPVDTSHIRQEFGHRKPEFPDFGMYGVSSTDEDDTPGGIEALKMRRNRMDSLMNTMNELNRAMEYFVGSMLHEEQNLSDQYSVNMPQDG